jgi:hypothetical protein
MARKDDSPGTAGHRAALARLTKELSAARRANDELAAELAECKRRERAAREERAALDYVLNNIEITPMKRIEAELQRAGEDALASARSAYQELEAAHRKLQGSFEMLEGLVCAEGVALTGQLFKEAASELDKRLSFLAAELVTAHDTAESLAVAPGDPERAPAEAPPDAGGRIAEELREALQGVGSLARVLGGIASGAGASSLRSAPPIDVGAAVAQVTPPRLRAAGGGRAIAQRQAPPVIACVEAEALREAIRHVLAFLRDYRHAASDPPPISVEVDAPDGVPRVLITDPALQIAPHEAAALLRLEASGELRRSPRLRRIGLAVAACALARNRGTLTLEPAEAGGTSFSIRLAPADQSARDAASAR